jgi:hypothetical protein
MRGSVRGREASFASSSGAKRSQPAPAVTSSRPSQTRRPIAGRRNRSPKSAAKSGARTKRVVMRTAEIRRISQKNNSNPGSPTAADQASSGASVSHFQRTRCVTVAVPANPAAAVAPAIAAMGAADFAGKYVATCTARQLVAAMHPAARITAQNAHPASIEFGRSTGKKQSVPPTAASAAINPPVLCRPVTPPTYGSKTTAKTGTSENSATRVSSGTHRLEKQTSHEGATNNPRPIKTAPRICRPLGHAARRTTAINAAATVSQPNGNASLSICGRESGFALGNKSIRNEPKDHRKQSRSDTATGATLVFSRLNQFMLLIRTHCPRYVMQLDAGLIFSASSVPG